MGKSIAEYNIRDLSCYILCKAKALYVLAQYEDEKNNNVDLSITHFIDELYKLAEILHKKAFEEEMEDK